MNLLYILLGFFIWWFTKGFALLIRYEGAVLKYLMGMFSVKESVFNLFAPWKKLVSARRPGLDGLRDWIIDNLISRGVGFAMRLILLGFFFVSLMIYLGFAVLFIAIWLGWPIMIFALIILGATHV
jgi:hypothetical protein